MQRSKNLTIIIASCLILSSYKMHAMFSSAGRKAAPAMAAAGTVGLTTFGIGRGEDNRVIPEEQLKGPDMRVTASKLQQAYEGLPESNLYKSTQSALRNSAKKVETGIEKILYGPKEVPFNQIKGLKFDQLTSDAQRVAYLRKQFENISVAADFNLPLIAHFLNNFTHAQCTDFINTVMKFADRDHAQVITMTHVDKAFADRLGHFDSESYFASQGLVTEEEIEQFVQESLVSENIKHMITLWDTGIDTKKGDAYHEAGHALICALNYSGNVVDQLTLQSKGIFAAAVIVVPSSNSKNMNGPVINDMNDQFLQHAENEIQGLLAGGLAEALGAGQEPQTIEDFFKVSSGANSGMGDIGLPGSDMDEAFQVALNYYKLKNKPFAILDKDVVHLTEEEVAQQAFELMEDCYYKVDATLRQNKPMLDKIVQIAMQDDYVPGAEIYRIAGRVQPKFEFELTLAEKLERSVTRWVAWTLKRIEFYNQQTESF